MCLLYVTVLSCLHIFIVSPFEPPQEAQSPYYTNLVREWLIQDSSRYNINSESFIKDNVNFI